MLLFGLFNLSASGICNDIAAPWQHLPVPTGGLMFSQLFITSQWVRERERQKTKKEWVRERAQLEILSLGGSQYSSGTKESNFYFNFPKALDRPPINMSCQGTGIGIEIVFGLYVAKQMISCTIMGPHPCLSKIWDFFEDINEQNVNEKKSHIKKTHDMSKWNFVLGWRIIYSFIVS